MKKMIILTVIASFLIGNTGLRAGTLHDAVKYGDFQKVQNLIDKGADLNAIDYNHYPSRNHGTPLGHAAKRGYKDIAKLLINNGADVNGIDNFRRTPLILAATYGHKNIVKLLLAQKNIDINAGDNMFMFNFNMNALRSARKRGHTEIVELLKAHGAK